MKSLYEQTVPGGWAWSHVLKKGTSLELTQTSLGGCAALTFFNPLDGSERYNMPDTLKGQYTAVLTKGHALYTDMGRIALTIVHDDFEGHDPLAGYLTQSDLEKRFGAKDYQTFRNEWSRSSQSCLVTELGKYGLDHRDLTSVVNFFCRVVVDESGAMSLQKTADAGRTVRLHAEMDTLVVFAATMHPFTDSPTWAPAPIALRIVKEDIEATNNPAWSRCEQNQRGFENTALYGI